MDNESETQVQVEEEISDGSMLVCQMKKIFFFFFIDKPTEAI